MIILLISLTAGVSSGQSLDDYVSKAINNSPFLKSYSIQLEAHSIDSLKVLAGFKPQVGITADLMYPPAIGKFAYDSALSDGGHYAALVRISQPLFYRKIAEVHLQSSFIQKLATENDRKITEAELAEAVTAQYVTTYADFSQVEFFRSVLKMLRNQEKVLKQFVEKGICQQTDYLNLAITISSREIAARQMHRQYRNDLALLNLLCGIHDTASVELKKPELILRNTFDIDSSPNMVQFRIDSLKSVNDHLLTDLDYRPRLGAYADAGFNAITPRRIPYNLGTSFGLSFTMPLYDGKQRQLEHRRIALSESSRVNFKSFFINRYQQQKDQYLDQLALTDNILRQMQNQLSGFEKLMSLYQVEIDRGMVRWLDFITVVNNYAQARSDYAQAELSRLQIINQLNYLK